MCPGEILVIRPLNPGKSMFRSALMLERALDTVVVQADVERPRGFNPTALIFDELAAHAEPEKPQITHGPPRKGKKGKVKRW